TVCGEDQYQNRYQQHTRDRDPCGGGFSDNREWTLRNRHGHERVEIVNNANLFQQRRQQEVEPLPKIKHHRRNNRITNKQSDHEKERTITKTPKHRDTRVGEQLPEATSFSEVAHAL